MWHIAKYINRLVCCVACEAQWPHLFQGACIFIIYPKTMIREPEVERGHLRV